MKALTKFNLSRVATQGLRLQIDADQARAGAIRNAHWDWRTCSCVPQTGLHDERYVVSPDLPSSVIGKPLVWQTRLRPSRVEETDLAVFGAHVGSGSLDYAAIHVELQRPGFPVIEDQLVDLPHLVGRFLPDVLHLGLGCVALGSWTLGRIVRKHT